jgi:thiol-disulfide isomerase/thioredoxin
MVLKAIIAVLLLLVCSSLKTISQEPVVPVVNFNEFEKNLQNNSDTVFVINFWATWCAPCRKELPEFQKIHTDFTGKQVKVLLVSLDFINQAEKTLKNFLSSNSITAPVILLNEPDANAWIDKVSPTWSGAIPATLIYRKDKRLFYEQVLTYQDIKNSISTLTNF